MLKSLHKSNIQTAPFVVTKDWNLSSIDNDWLVLTEHSGSPIALEYEEYLETTSSLNSNCNIALEQQGADLVVIRDGEKTTGTFYPDIDNTNKDGTYKRMVYSQVYNMFYNNFRDPTKIWGLEYLDFENSQTKRFLTNTFRTYNIPTDVFGENIVKNTVVLRQPALDNEYDVVDDGKGNLFAVFNLFSRQQELREFGNVFNSATSNSYCGGYFGWIDPYVRVNVVDTPWNVSVGISAGSLIDADPQVETGNFDVGLLSGFTLDTTIITSGSDSGSVDSAFYSGSLVTAILWTSGSESGSVDSAFYSGSLTTIILWASGSDSGSVDSAFYSASLVVLVLTSSYSDNPSIDVGLSSGSLN